LRPGDVIPYLTMCIEEGCNLQRGMNYRLRGKRSVVLMNVGPNAPYADRVEEDGRVLIYEGHNANRTVDLPEPETVDQPMYTPKGTPTANGRFFEVARAYSSGEAAPELVRVYEKIRDGIWVYNGTFELTDAHVVRQGGRKVFKFRLELTDATDDVGNEDADLIHNRMIPSPVKAEVWRRDKGRCVICGSTDNLHYDHDLPYSKGGTSLLAENIRLLRARHNLQKGAKIE
jgi:hypothetical protein